MTTFFEASQVRLQLKMKYSHYAWYSSSMVFPDGDGFGVLIGARFLDNKIRRLVSPVVDGVSVKVEND